MRNHFTLLCAACLLAACASTPPGKSDTAATPAPETPAAPAPEMAAPAGAETTTQGVTESAKAAEQEGLQDKSVYFDFDSFVVKPEYRELLNQHAAILKAHPQDTVTLEGNADERGSPEYNLALGSKRARAVRAQLTLLNIAGSRMHEASFGEEKPRASCHDESCWKQNRRVDFTYRSNQ
ncbi:MAG TPA: peptidoglycan-associated lipoprotein Pal [Gallionellaceae bacterium]|nr:peptidoglycan-associated lipoprotein Pal [Gallionellaceae bacterium]